LTKSDAAGELGYVRGGWEAVWDDDSGHHEMLGKYLAVWRRERDQRWKIVVRSASTFRGSRMNRRGRSGVARPLCCTRLWTKQSSWSASHASNQHTS